MDTQVTCGPCGRQFSINSPKINYDLDDNGEPINVICDSCKEDDGTENEDR